MADSSLARDISAICAVSLGELSVGDASDETSVSGAVVASSRR